MKSFDDSKDRNIARDEISSENESFFATDEDFAIMKNFDEVDNEVKEDTLEIKKKIGNFVVKKVELKSRETESPVLKKAKETMKKWDENKSDLDLTKKLISSFQSKPRISYGLKPIEECSELEGDDYVPPTRRKRQGRKSRWSSAIGSREKLASCDTGSNPDKERNYDIGINEICITRNNIFENSPSYVSSSLARIEAEIIPEEEDEASEDNDHKDHVKKLEKTEEKESYLNTPNSKNLSLNTTNSNLVKTNKINSLNESKSKKKGSDIGSNEKMFFNGFSVNVLKKGEENDKKITFKSKLRTKSLNSNSNAKNPVDGYRRKSTRRKRNVNGNSVDYKNMAILKKQNQRKMKSKGGKKKNTVSVNEVVKSYLQKSSNENSKKDTTSYKKMKKFLFPDKVRYGVAKSIDFSYGRKKL